MNGGMAGKVALVTGGTSGIGRAAALAFAAAGAKVVVSGRRVEAGEGTVKLVEQAGGEALFVRADIAKAADVGALVRKTIEAFGGLDYAFNNAGIEQVPTPTQEQTEETFDAVFATNVKGVWLSMQAEIPEMLKRGGGAIVNTSSIAGQVAFPGTGIYVASKHAVEGLTKAVALEFATQGIRVNAVSPAAIETDMLDRFVGGAEGKSRMASMHPIGRVGRSEEVAAAVLWLCSEAASFVTGHALPVDGGFLAQ